VGSGDFARPHLAATVRFRTMSTLRRRIAARDRDLFVGREPELRRIAEIVADRLPYRVIHVVGIGGIGKSALLREAARRAAERGVETVWIDGRDVPPFPAEIELAIERVRSASAAFVVFDSYELIGSLDSHLREQLLPDLPDSTVVAFGSRSEPSDGWFEHGWEHVVDTIRLGPLDPEQATALVVAHGVDDPAEAAEVVREGRGSPLALVVGADTFEAGSASGRTSTLADIAERLVGREVEPERRRTLGVAALAKVTTPELLADALGDHDPQESFKWLAGRTFSEPLAEGVTLHALVAEAVRANLRRTDPSGEAALRRRIADHLHRRAIAGHHGLSADLQYLVLDQRVRWGFAADVGQRYRIDRLGEGDANYVGAVLDAIGAGEWWRATRVFFEEAPETVGIARDSDGKVGGYFIAVSPGNAPPQADADPLLGPWLRHARDVLRTNSAVLWREAVDLTGELGEVTSLLGAGGIVATGVANPRYGFLPITPRIPAAAIFSAALGAIHVPSLDLYDYGMELECHIVDFGPGGLLGFQREWVYRETGAAPPAPVPDDDLDPVALVRLLREPSELAVGREWLGATPSERLDALRGLVTRSLDVFGSSDGDRTDRAIVEAAYLGDAAPHEAIARRLHLSRTTYFRRLHAATDRLADEVAARLRAGR
jgi:hypothetical protein